MPIIKIHTPDSARQSIAKVSVGNETAEILEWISDKEKASNLAGQVVLAVSWWMDLEGGKQLESAKNHYTQRGVDVENPMVVPAEVSHDVADAMRFEAAVRGFGNNLDDFAYSALRNFVDYHAVKFFTRQ